jgi:hypothetical protein
MKDLRVKDIYFKDVKVGDEIFGLVFGKGKVSAVWGNSYYNFEVEFENGYTVPYTLEGVPGWNGKLDFQTIFYVDDFDFISQDISPSNTLLDVKDIIKFRILGFLEIKCPSGIWQPISKCPGHIMEEYLEDNKLHLFRFKENLCK